MVGRVGRVFSEEMENWKSAAFILQRITALSQSKHPRPYFLYYSWNSFCTFSSPLYLSRATCT